MDAQGWFAIVLLSIVLVFGPAYSCSQRQQHGVRATPLALPPAPQRAFPAPDPNPDRDYRAYRKLIDPNNPNWKMEND